MTEQSVSLSTLKCRLASAERAIATAEARVRRARAAAQSAYHKFNEARQIRDALEDRHGALERKRADFLDQIRRKENERTIASKGRA